MGVFVVRKPGMDRGYLVSGVPLLHRGVRTRFGRRPGVVVVMATLVSNLALLVSGPSAWGSPWLARGFCRVTGWRGWVCGGGCGAAGGVVVPRDPLAADSLLQVLPVLLLLLLTLGYPVADAGFGEDVFGVLGVVAEFAAESHQVGA